ncbi:serine/threonine-protein kinase [Streptomyces sp. NPDC048481]|uniref:serine/threonine-protein kinase n=1 Tax=Streptomyces sp. NPDC048481 TaxID=3365557 RepID=UPI00371E5C45
MGNPGTPEIPGSAGDSGSGGFPGLLVARRYRLVESIGQGGMGRVWRAVDEVLDRPVAVKEMRIDGMGSEDTRTRRERTLREARATARIDHPHVVRVYDVVDEGERLWIVMELVAGRSLEQIMAEDGPLDPRETARIGLGLVTALREVHARGVLHRDIKPGNVLVEHGGRGAGERLGDDGPRAGEGGGQGDGREPGDRRGSGERRVVLTDFGIAAIQDAKALTMVGMLVGSPDYMAPERVSGRPQGPPSDVWSLGATLCAALAGNSPFARNGTLATLHAVLYEEPRLPPEAGPLHAVLAALLLKDPAARPTLTDLEAVLAPIAFPPPAPPPTPPPSPTPALTPTSPPPQPQPQPPPPGPVPVPTPTPVPAPVPTLRVPPRPAPQLPHPHPQPPPPVPPAGEPPTSTLLDSRGPVPQTPGSPAPARPGRRASGALVTVVAAVVLVVAGAVTAVLLATDPGAHDGGGRTAGASPGPSAAGGAPVGGSAAGGAAATGAAPSASPTVEGTFRPPSLPPGAHQEAGGFAWATPRGWRRDVKTGAEVHYTSPDGLQELVAKSSLARGDLMDTWRTSEQSARAGRDYRKIRLEETTFRGLRAVVWEYTFTLKGTPWHARLLGFDENGKSYQVNTWYQPGVEAAALRTYDKVKAGFTVT